jgi:hypothetical protein
MNQEHRRRKARAIGLVAGWLRIEERQGSRCDLGDRTNLERV